MDTITSRTTTTTTTTTRTLPDKIPLTVASPLNQSPGKFQLSNNAQFDLPTGAGALEDAPHQAGFKKLSMAAEAVLDGMEKIMKLLTAPQAVPMAPSGMPVGAAGGTPQPSKGMDSTAGLDVLTKMFGALESQVTGKEDGVLSISDIKVAAQGEGPLAEAAKLVLKDDVLMKDMFEGDSKASLADLQTALSNRQVDLSGVKGMGGVPMAPSGMPV